MAIKFTHTNIISRNCRVLARFYQDVFGCVQDSQERIISGSWVDRGTGVRNARIKVIHLKLPGYGEGGPTLEIFEYDSIEDRQNSSAKRLGFGHIAFHTDDVEATRKKVLDAGGRELGKLTRHEFPGVGELEFIYMRDPEGNIIEIQKWDKTGA